jgi:hypothetical protein
MSVLRAKHKHNLREEENINCPAPTPEKLLPYLLRGGEEKA